MDDDDAGCVDHVDSHLKGNKEYWVKHKNSIVLYSLY